jgi:8-oxo-dGTP pyrophosphatase MutT (NUDIX family)
MAKAGNFEVQVIKNKLAHQTLKASTKIKICKSENTFYKSAVLLPIVVLLGEINILYTLRSASLDRHSGQVSFPGGLMERSDNSLLETALRETREEIGVTRDNIEILGQLKPQKTTSGGIVYPFVGIISTLASLKRNENEVERIFFIPLEWLCGPSHSSFKNFVANDGKIRKVWFYDEYEGELLWGITAKITHEFIEIIKK